MTKEIRLNAFDMNCVVHQSAGLWTHPRDRAVDYTSLEYWTDLAQILERGRFDGLFIADVLGVYDVYGGNADTALSQGIQVPLNDPAAGDSADGTGHQASRIRGDLHPLVRAALPIRAPHVDAGSSDPRTDRMEHRDRLPQQRGKGRRDGRAECARPSL